MKDELIFRECPEEDCPFEDDDFNPIPSIEVGNWCKNNYGGDFFSPKLVIIPELDKVYTRCGDNYMDYGISFDDFLTIADKIRELKKGEK